MQFYVVKDVLHLSGLEVRSSTFLELGRKASRGVKQHLKSILILL